MSIFASFAPRMETYSIDEAFLDFAGVRGDLVAIGREVRERVLQWIGVPCGIGLGTTKTMAKLANHIAKSADRKPGSYPAELAQVCDLGSMSTSEREALYAATPVKEVWGVGPRIGARLKAQGVDDVLQLARLDAPTMRRQFSVMLEKTVRELQGIPCIGLEDAPAARQQIMVSRSFGAAVTEGRDLASAVTSFASRAAEKLRKQGEAAGAVMVFIGTSPFRKADDQYGNSITVPLVQPSADTRVLVDAAIAGLRRIWRRGYRYAKAGVMLVDLQPQELRQGMLDLPSPSLAKCGRAASMQDKTKLMTAVDSLNRRFGRGSVLLASAGVEKKPRPWVMKQERRTPRYTTCWAELPLVRA